MRFRGMLPKCSAPLAEYGRANTDEEVQAPTPPAATRGSHTLLANHCVTEPTTWGSPIRSGRSEVTPVSVFSVVMMFTGLPDCTCSTPVICQPSFNRLPWKGSSYVPLMLKRCRTSKSDGP